MLTKLYSGFSNNFRLIQFQYKLLMRISTCRYSRYKMKIDKVSGYCYHCKDELETLPHIYLICPIAKLFVARVTRLIIENLDDQFEDPTNIVYLTCCHSNPIINLVLAMTKYYLSRRYQYHKDISWQDFRNFVMGMLGGEKLETKRTIEEAFMIPCSS